MKRQLWQERCQSQGHRRGALEMAPCDVFANDLEENVPSDVGDSAGDFGPFWVVGCQANGDKCREVFRAQCVGKEAANELRWSKAW